jgi:hypothetical protein
MSDRRWYNPNLPQTLGIAQILLYINAAFMLLGVLAGGGIGLLGAVALAAYVYGGYGIANSRRRGYQVAVAASFFPLALRAFVYLTGAADVGIAFVFFSTNVLSVVFEYALIALLLHPQSREHQRVWFS